MSGKECCEVCKFFLEDAIINKAIDDGDIDIPKQGNCRRRAPHPLVKNGFPTVLFNEWCGEFKSNRDIFFCYDRKTGEKIEVGEI